MKMPGANTNSKIQGIEEAVTKSGYFVGSDQSKWLTEISNFQNIKVTEVYKDIDLIYRSSEQKLEYDFHIAPEADPNLIRLEFGGIKKIKIDRAGNLIFKFKGIELRHQKPFAYQIINGEKREINVGYTMFGENRIGFKVGDYDTSKELIIDPVVYASYLGGAEGGGNVRDIAVDKNGYNYAASDERIQKNPGDPSSTYSNIVVTKFNPAGNLPIYRYSYGGSADDGAYAIDVDADGKVYLTGVTFSNDFPLHFAEQSSHSISVIQLDSMAFVMRLYENGSIQYSTYLGGGCVGTYTENSGQSIVADVAGNAYVTGFTCSPTFPVKNAFQSSLQSTGNTFLAKYDPFGHLVYSTYFGGGYSYNGDVAVDERGNAYIVGYSKTGLHTTAGAYKTSGLGFAAKFDTTKSGAQSLVYSTYIDTPGTSAAVDRSGNLWVATGSGYCGNGCSIDPNLFKLNANGTGLMNSPILLINYRDGVWDIAIDKNDNLFYVESEISGLKVVGLRSDGTLIERSGFDTGTGRTRIWGVAAGPEPGIVYIAGITTSTNFPTTPGAYQPTHNSPNTRFFGQGFIAKFQMDVPEEREPLIFIPGIAGSTLYEADANGDPIENLWADGLTQIFLPTQKLRKLTLNPDDAPFSRVVAVDALRDISVPGYTKDIYRSFLADLASNGNYKEMVGCSPDYSGEKPNLFVLPYDWRLSNSNSAAKLSDLVNCIQQIYPGKKVNILTHSMGGLVARRYVINHPNNHNVNKLVTMVAPWLGAPKAIGALFTGKFLGPPFDYVYPKQIKNIVRFGEAPHQLLPSAWYFINGGRPLAYRSSTSINYEDYSYSQTFDFINEQFPYEPPYTNSAIFHQDEPRQDNWVSDVSGIKYYHLFGRMKCDDTIGHIFIHPTIAYPLPRDAGERFSVDSTTTQGDGTVPVLSANRPSTMLAPNTIVRPYVSPSCQQDGNYKHNEILRNEQFKSEILAILSDNSPQQIAVKAGDSMAVNNESANFNPEDLMNYLEITGVNRLDINDENGNSNISLGAMDKPVPEISYEYGSSVGEALVFPHEVIFPAGKIADVKFRASTDKISIKNIKGFGRENAAETSKYLDLQLPLGVIVWLKFTTNGLESLRYDADSDGVFETEVQPTFHLTGAAANDRTPPDINISFTVNNNSATITVNSTDTETGINQIRYIVNGETSDHVYNAPFSVDLTQSKLLYVSAEDSAGNRNILAKWLDVAAPQTTAIQTPVSNQNGWSKEVVNVQIKSFDDLGGSGVESLTYSGSGAQNFPEETLSIKEVPFTFPSPSAASDFLAKSLTVNVEGITNLTFFGKDKAGNLETTKTAAVKIDKTAPETASSYVQNGNRMIVTLNATDALSGVDRVSYSVDGGNPQTYTVPFAVSGAGNHTVAFVATDKAGNVEATKSLSFTIVVVNPDVAITAPSSGSVYPVGATVNFAGNFSGDSCSLHSAVWTFDNISQAAIINETNQTVAANYAFTTAGVYLVTLTVNNNCGGTGSANTIGDLTAMIVIYDPDGGFVTGGGWIDSPLGAYTPNPNLTGRASFGFNSKYQRGATVPTGNTEFQFRVADFNFKSTSYDWLVVGGAKAQYKGSGTINGNGNYGFLLTAIDGQINGGGGQDKFRIKIWNKTTNAVIYDNQIGTPDGTDPTTVIGGGSIIIHRQ